MFQIDVKSRKPIYEQVVENFKRLIITGALKENERAPSVRDLAGALTVNPNTVQKAYRELESLGYFYTVIGQGSYVSPPPAGSTASETALLYKKLREILSELAYYGEDKSRVLEFIGKTQNTPYPADNAAKASALISPERR